MRAQLMLVLCLLTQFAAAQTDYAGISPRVSTAAVPQDAVMVLHLRPGYTTSVRFPEEITSVAIGDLAHFKAEHSEAEPRLVFLKPITEEPSDSNALVTTKSGQEISFHLISSGKTSADTGVDFFVDYRRRRTLLIDSDDQSLLIGDTRALALDPPQELLATHEEKPDAIAKALESQRHFSPPIWEGKELLATIGNSTQRNRQTILGFSILNNSQRVIELLPPQLELGGTRGANSRKRIKAEPIVISEYRMTTRRLAPGQRADGVVAFDRPAFKESTEQLQLQLAEAAEVDRPILLPVPFISSDGGSR